MKNMEEKFEQWFDPEKVEVEIETRPRRGDIQTNSYSYHHISVQDATEYRVFITKIGEYIVSYKMMADSEEELALMGNKTERKDRTMFWMYNRPPEMVRILTPEMKLMLKRMEEYVALVTL